MIMRCQGCTSNPVPNLHRDLKGVFYRCCLCFNRSDSAGNEPQARAKWNTAQRRLIAARRKKP